MSKKYIITDYKIFIAESNIKEVGDDDEVKSKEDIIDQFSSLVEDPALMDRIKSTISKKSFIYCQGYLDGYIKGEMDSEKEKDTSDDNQSIPETNEKNNTIEYNNGLEDGMELKMSIAK